MFLPGPSLSIEEYAMQRPQVKRTWAKNVIERGWGAELLARVYLRRTLGREPTQQEVKAASTSKERRRIKTLVTVEQVMNAYFKGEEIRKRDVILFPTLRSSIINL